MVSENLWEVTWNEENLKLIIRLATMTSEKRQLRNLELIDNLKYAMQKYLEIPNKYFASRTKEIKKLTRLEICFDLLGEPSQNDDLVDFIENFLQPVVKTFGDFDVSILIKICDITYNESSLPFIQNLAYVFKNKYSGNGKIVVALNYDEFGKQKKCRETVTSALERISIFEENLCQLRDQYFLEIMVGDGFFVPKPSKLSRLVSKKMFAIQLVGKTTGKVNTYIKELKADGWTIVNETKGE